MRTIQPAPTPIHRAVEHATCSCGWHEACPTRREAMLAGGGHIEEAGLDGHLVNIGGAR